MDQTAWIALIVIGLLVIVGIIVYIVVGHRPSTNTTVFVPVPVFEKNRPHHFKGPENPPNGYNPSLGPTLNPSLGPNNPPNGYNPNLTPPPVHNLLPGATLKDLSEAFAPAL